jgi:uncharacterized protein (TIGR02594 family)
VKFAARGEEGELVDPPWVVEARRFIGLREIKGPKHHPEILLMWRDIGRGGIRDDETAWCSAFAGSMLERSGFLSTRFEGAKSWLDWGVVLVEPVHGCVVVLSRPGGAHVGFAVGLTRSGWVRVLAGNQGDSVSIASFRPERVLGYRMPRGYVFDGAALALNGESPESTGEA